MASPWSGRRVTRARAHFLPLLPLPCGKCGLDVHPDQRWQVGHQRARALGGGHDLGNLWPEHGRCNESDGGKLGHALAGHRVKRPDRARLASVPVVERREWP